MKQDTRQMIWPILLVAFYIALAVTGMYTGVSFILAPILAIPLIIYLVKLSPIASVQCVINVIIVGGIYLITGNLQNILLYIACIVLPAYMISWLYKNRLPLPNIIIYGTMISSVAIYIYIMIMKSLGVNYELAFIKLIDELQRHTMQTYKEVAEMMGYVSEADQATLKTLLNDVMSMIKQVYPAFVIIGVFSVTFIKVLIVNFILRLKDRTLPSVKQLLGFKLSKIVILINIGAIIILSLVSSNAAIIVSINLVLIINMLFGLMGALAFIGLINKTSISMLVKVLVYIIIFIIYSTTPTVLIIFGVLDTIFNYRKVDIIV